VRRHLLVKWINA